MSVVLIATLTVLAVLLAIMALIFWTGWQVSRRSAALLAQRLDTEAQIEASTLETMSAMREAARAYARRQ